EGQWGVVLAGTREDAHPSRGEGSHWIGEASGPQVFQGGRRTERDGAGEICLVRRTRELKASEVDAPALVVARDLLHCAVKVDRLVVSGLANQRHHALCLAERIGSDEMSAVRK